MGFTLEIGKKAPDFLLPGVDGKSYSLADFSKYKVLVVVFSCNHCPYVVGNEERMIGFAREYGPRGVGFVAINANEDREHSDDSLENMVKRAKEKGFPFPYLRDQSQETAKAYGAIKTPHFFVFDTQRTAAYTGRMDDNPRDAASASTHELKDAVEALLAGDAVAIKVTEPIGCTVKWWGRDAHWIPTDICDFLPGVPKK